MSDRQIKRLGEIITLNYGKGLPQTKRIDGAVPVYSSAGITGYHNESLVNIPGIIVGRKGTVGSVYFSDTAFCCIDTAYYLTKNDTQQDFLYVYYLLKHLPLDKMNTDSAVPGLNRDNAYSLEINLPSLLTQRRIAAILSSLDDRIENNRKTCEKLEEIAQAIFKRWFVAFEFPNEEGQPYKSSGGEMVVCEELGKEIPKGWEVNTFGEIVNSISEKHSFNKQELVFLNTSDIYNGEVLKRGYTDIETLPGQAKKSIQRKDILYSEIRPKNRRFAFIDFDCDDYVVSTKLMVLRCKSIELSSLIYFYLTNQNTINDLQMLAESRSGTFPQIRFENLKNMKIPLPKSCCELAIVFKAYLKSIQRSRKEIEALQQTRDALLPKLMSGELAVDDVEV